VSATDPLVAKMVVPGRCSCCGHKLIQWTPQKIVDAGRRWAEEHGESPKQRDWSRGTPDHPALTAVYNTFGTWARFLKAAGLPPTKRMPQRVWSKDTIAEAMLTWVLRTGSWPTSGDWHSGGQGFPANRTVYDFFPSWNAAKAHAGWAGGCRNCDRQLKAGQTIWCSDRCRRTYRPAPRKQPVCVGCGAELETQTRGCAQCSDRASKRRAREKLIANNGRTIATERLAA
jgi:hypothetical protein